MKQKPDFLIIGAMKSATISLFNYLKCHKQVVMPKAKELHYYDKKRYHNWDVSHYLESFPLREDHLISGEATPFYLRHPHAPKWVKQDFPEIKLIIILRNPTNRAYSHYQQRLHNGKEKGLLLEALKLEKETLSSKWKKFEADENDQGNSVIELSYLSRGRYIEQIKNWLRHFPLNQMLILFTEELEKSQLIQMNKVAEFLNIEAFSDAFSKPKFHRRNYPQIDSHTKMFLDNYFRDYNQELFSFLKIPPLW